MDMDISSCFLSPTEFLDESQTSLVVIFLHYNLPVLQSLSFALFLPLCFLLHEGRWGAGSDPGCGSVCWILQLPPG